ncbi:MAG: MltR family transcriptional regulator [Anaerolineaceae bacterium]
MDSVLRELLASFMIEDKKATDELLGREEGSDGPISSFGARIVAAYCLGLISRMEYEDLLLIKKIRNKFAHKNFGFTFENSEIIKWCNKLQTPNELDQVLPPEIDNPNGRFAFTIYYLSPLLTLRVFDAKKEKRIVRDKPEIGQVVQIN